MGGWGPKQTSQLQGSPSLQARPGPVIPGTSLGISDPAAGKPSSRLPAMSHPTTLPPSVGTLRAQSFHSCLNLCGLMDCSQPGSSVHRILQARIMEWVATSFSSHLHAAAAKSLQSCPTLCDPIDGSPPGSPFPGILQARTLEWVAISFSNA